ncbi:hypothetical protein FGG78_21530 [Thioclava sp. BHET1]|nr:hypothetical protein FGG78_21530 [Thioclava sp. BHET1]
MIWSKAITGTVVAAVIASSALTAAPAKADDTALFGALAAGTALAIIANNNRDHRHYDRRHYERHRYYERRHETRYYYRHGPGRSDWGHQQWHNGHHGGGYQDHHHGYGH